MRAAALCGLLLLAHAAAPAWASEAARTATVDVHSAVTVRFLAAEGPTCGHAVAAVSVDEPSRALRVSAEVDVCPGAAPPRVCWSVSHEAGALLRCAAGEGLWVDAAVVMRLPADDQVSVTLEVPELPSSRATVGLVALLDEPEPLPEPLQPRREPVEELLQSTVDCEAALSCRLTDVMLVPDEMVVQLFGRISVTETERRLLSGKDDEDDEGDDTREAFSTSTSSRSVWARLQGTCNDTVLTTLRAEVGFQRDQPQPGADTCLTDPVVVLSLPYPSYYWHGVVDSLLPLAHTLRQLGRPARIALTHDYAASAQPVAPAVLALLRRLSPFPLTTLAGLGRGCVRELVVGHYPALRRRTERAAAADWLLAAAGVARPPPARRHADALRLTLVQRRRRVNNNFPGQRGQAAVRAILNVPELMAAAALRGHATQLVFLEDLPVRAQLQVAVHSDVFVAVHGGAWATTAFLPRASAAVQLLGYGLREACPTELPTYRYVHGGDDDACESFWWGFPGLPPGHYIEWSKETAEGFGYPFRFVDYVCPGPAADADPACVAEALEREAEVLRDPYAAWMKDRKFGHWFFKNQNMRVPVEEFVGLLEEGEAVVEALSRRTSSGWSSG